MKGIFVSAAIVLAGLMGTATVHADAPSFTTELMASTGGGVQYTLGDKEWNRSFDFQQYFDYQDGTIYTTFRVSFEVEGPGFYQEAELTCTVDNNSFTVTLNRAMFDVVIADPSVQSCDGAIYTYEPYFTTSPWTGPVEVAGAMMSPTSTRTEITLRTYSAPEEGDFRQQCQNFSGWDVGAGSVSFSNLDGSFTYFPFASGDDADLAHGGYFYEVCKGITKEPKEK